MARPCTLLMSHYQDEADASDFEDHSSTETLSLLALPILHPLDILMIFCLPFPCWSFCTLHQYGHFSEAILIISFLPNGSRSSQSP